MTEVEYNHATEGSTPSVATEPDMTEIRPTADFIIEPPISDPASPEELAAFLKVPAEEVQGYINLGNLRLTMKTEDPDQQYIQLDDVWRYLHSRKSLVAKCTVEPGDESYCELGYYMNAKHRLKHGEPKSENLPPF